MEKISGILVTSGSSLESIVGQLQKHTESIMCVKGGLGLFIYKELKFVEDDLEYRSQVMVPKTSVVEYRFISRKSKVEYCFFDSRMYDWIVSNKDKISSTFSNDSAEIEINKVEIDNNAGLELKHEESSIPDNDVKSNVKSDVLLTGKIMKIDIDSDPESGTLDQITIHI